MRVDQAKIRYPAESNAELQEQNTRPSVFTERLRGEYYNIDVTKLIPFHKQARKYFDEESIVQLGETIKAHGIRQPLTIISTDDMTGMYEVVSGERRLRAAILIGLKTVPCLIIQDHKAAVEIALIENIQRKDLHPLELAKAYQQLIEESICTSQIEIAEKLGLPKSSISETMQLLSLPEIIQNKLLEENIFNRKLFRDILEEKNSSKMLNAIEKYKNTLALQKNNKMTKKKKTILLKVSIYDNKIDIESNLLDKLENNKRIEVKKKLLEIFEKD